MKINNTIDAMKQELFYNRCRRCVRVVLPIQAISFIIFTFFININITSPSVWLYNVWELITWRTLLPFGCLFGICIILCSFHVNNLSVRDPPVSSKWNLFWRIFQCGNLFQVVFYSILSGLSSYCCLSLKTDLNSTLLVASNNKYCFNEIPVFAVCYGLIGGFMIGGYYFYHRSNILKFPLIQQSKLLRVREPFWDTIASCGARSFNVCKYFLAIYILFLGTSLTDSLIYTFGVSERCESYELSSFYVLTDWRLLLVTSFSFFYFCFNCQLTYLIFQVLLTESYPFSIDVTKPSSSIPLLTALSCIDCPFILHLASYDLLIISQHNDQRSNVIFAISFPGGHAYNWKAISSHCLVLLKQFIDRLTCNVTSDVNLTTTGQPRLTVTMESDVKKYKELRRIFIVSKWIRRRWDEIVFKWQQIPLVQFFVPTSTFHDQRPREVFADCQIYIWIIQALTNFVVSSITLNKFGVVQAEVMDIITLLMQLEQDLDKRQLRNVKSVLFQRDYFLKKSLTLTVKTSLNRLAFMFAQQLDCLPLSPEQKRNFVDRI